MKQLITYCLYALGIIGVINALIKFGENTHKYGPFVAKAVIEKTTTFGQAFSVKNALGPLITSLLLVSLNISTETALAPSPYSKVHEVSSKRGTYSVWISERTGKRYIILSDLSDGDNFFLRLIQAVDNSGPIS